jgi:D-sedoheptulose 7-phosphate isomerase
MHSIRCCALSTLLRRSSRAADDTKLRATIYGIADTIAAAFRGGHKLLIAGNGGSAADAQHIAGEFLSRFNFDRNPLPAIALTTDSWVLTAIGNDYGFEQTFER